MKAEDTLHQILHWALVEIRYEAAQVKNDKIVAIAHTLHNFPIYLLDAKNEDDYKALLAQLEETIKDDKAWISLINQAKKRAKERKSDE